MPETKICISCRKAVENDRSAIAVACPACGSAIVRCGNCRKTAVQYKCPCSFEGP